MLPKNSRHLGLVSQTVPVKSVRLHESVERVLAVQCGDRARIPWGEGGRSARLPSTRERVSDQSDAACVT